ncbi:hypothetical protein Q0Z83_001840 [Actinoplanes sichuanensis]|nr:hypothetical protein Q0Z83_001840 [Actinoplanes sichuanensis]
MREEAGFADPERVGDLAEREPVQPGDGGEQQCLLEHRAAGAFAPDQPTVLCHAATIQNDRPFVNIEPVTADVLTYSM